MTATEMTPDQIEAMESRMAAAGESLVEKVQQDYFGFELTERVMLPDGISFVEVKALTEGEKQKHLNKTNREVLLKRSTGDAAISTAPGDERRSLLLTAVTGWNLVRNGEPLTFNRSNLEKFMDSANPKVVDEIIKGIHKANPWLLADMSVEDLDREIASLQELRQSKIDEQEGNVTSATK